MSLARLWAFLAIGLPVLAALIANLSAVDLAYHLRAGGIVLDTGRIPTTDTFTFTAAGEPWLNQQWGAQVILATVYRVAGWTGLALLRAVLVGLTFGLLFEACRRRGFDLRRAAWLTIAAFVVTAVALALRPQLFGMALLALTLLIVVERRAHPRLLWAVPVIVFAWASIHGSFILGPVVLGLAWLEDVHDRVPGRHRLLGVAVVAAAAALVNPFGIGVWAYAVGLSTNSFVTSRISEWQPTTLRTIPGILFFGSVAVAVLLLVRRGRPPTWPALAWLAVFAAIGTYAIRGVAWWPLGSAVAIAGVLAARETSTEAAPAPRRAERSSRLNVVFVGLIVLVCVALVPVWRPIDSRLGVPVGTVGDAPGGITHALGKAVRPGDRILNPQPWGSWFELALPQATVALDSRIEVFPAAVWDDYDAVHRGTDGWQAILARWAPTFVVATDDEDAFVARLTLTGWTVLYADDDGTILRRPAS
ncbi:MAG: hypothetical protein H0U52_10220 [Chloroflexi bacterium]|nr:hypothetical protein [Chloroflexota bacterium]